MRHLDSLPPSLSSSDPLPAPCLRRTGLGQQSTGSPRHRWEAWTKPPWLQTGKSSPVCRTGCSTLHLRWPGSPGKKKEERAHWREAWFSQSLGPKWQPSSYLHRFYADLSIILLSLQLQLHVQQSNLWVLIGFGLHFEPRVREGLLECHPSD